MLALSPFDAALMWFLRPEARPTGYFASLHQLDASMCPVGSETKEKIAGAGSRRWQSGNQLKRLHPEYVRIASLLEGAFGVN